MSMRIICTLAIAIALCLTHAHRAVAQPGSRDPIKVVNPKRLPGRDIRARRVALGIPNDYKPWIAKLKNGQLLIVAFCFGPVPDQEGLVERAVFWRSDDGGRTWGPREERLDIHGREFALTVLSDGSILMPCHFSSQDAFNNSGHSYSKLFRSTDHGKTWSEIRIGPEGFPERAATASDWNAFEMPDPENPDSMLTVLGVSMQYGKENAPKVVRLWRSRDSGETWDKELKPDTAGWIDVDGFFSQSVTYRAVSGKLLHPVRVDRTGPHWHIPGTPEKLKEERGDNGDRSMLWGSTDNGLTWKKHNKDGNFGTYGEMYARFLRLKDKRLLLTFTVRSNSTDGYPLGLRALVSYDDGETWDFKSDRLIISYVNHGHSGGSFGNTVQLDDGNLVSVYSYRGKDGMTHVEAIRWRLPGSSL